MRGQIWWVDLDPARGSEANKTRPAVVVGRQALAERALQRGTGVVTVVPVTGSTDRVLDFQLFLPAARTGLERDSKAQAEQLRSVDVRRLVGAAGLVPADLMSRLDDRIRLWLGL